MKKVKDIHILVVGDIMLDRYIIGNVSRISPEAPVPVVEVTGEYTVLGGCGNVAANIKSIGAEVTVLSSIGYDQDGKLLEEKLHKLGIYNWLCFESEITISKERVVAGSRQIQMLRIDREKIKPIDTKHIIDKVNSYPNDFDFIVVSDYAKGLITRELMDFLKTKNIKIIVDPKPAHRLYYQGVYMITPNEKEYNELTIHSDPLLQSVQYTLVTKGRKGMELYENGNSEPFVIPSEPVDVYNVSGAGDTVVATMAVAMSSGYSPLEAAKIANMCAGYAVTKVGTCVITETKYNEMVEKCKLGQ